MSSVRQIAMTLVLPVRAVGGSDMVDTRLWLAFAARHMYDVIGWRAECEHPVLGKGGHGLLCDTIPIPIG